ncbi:hypothetical protein V8G54_002888 [Vigna mungo]|uniref:Uncharacterized protein n=1 Tax=Vigna mungo TaxID=3915 RepID=A0AAQ3PB52_VIGMU
MLLSRAEGKRKSSKGIPEGPMITGPLDPNARIIDRMTTIEPLDMAYKLNIRFNLCMAYAARSAKSFIAKELETARQDLEKSQKTNGDLTRRQLQWSNNDMKDALAADQKRLADEHKFLSEEVRNESFKGFEQGIVQCHYFFHVPLNHPKYDVMKEVVDGKLVTMFQPRSTFRQSKHPNLSKLLRLVMKRLRLSQGEFVYGITEGHDAGVPSALGQGEFVYGITKRRNDSLWKLLPLLVKVHSSMESSSDVMQEFFMEAPSALSRAKVNSSMESPSGMMHDSLWKLLPLLAEVNSSTESPRGPMQEVPSTLVQVEFIYGITERRHARNSFYSWLRLISLWNHRAARCRSSLWKLLPLLVEVNLSMKSPSGAMQEFSIEAFSTLSRGEFVYRIIEQRHTRIPAKKLVDRYTNN